MMAARYFEYTQTRSIVGLPADWERWFDYWLLRALKWVNLTDCLYVCRRWRFSDDYPGTGNHHAEQIGGKNDRADNRFWVWCASGRNFSSKNAIHSPKMHNPDFVAIAKAYNIDGKLVTSAEDLDAATADMLKDDKPYLVVVEVEQKEMVYLMVPAGTCVTNIIM